VIFKLAEAPKRAGVVSMVTTNCLKIVLVVKFTAGMEVVKWQDQAAAA
jgi:hypothetical protein